MMVSRWRKNRNGFSLLEIMFVIVIIALLASIGIPNYNRARKRSQAVRILNDLRQIEAAIQQYAIEYGKARGTVIRWEALKPYLKPGTDLYMNGVSVIDGDYKTQDFDVDGAVSTPEGTRAVLSDVAPDEFWSPYTLK